MVVFFFGKKAMSPLLVTIFLVAFAVALGAMVVSWGSDDGKVSSTCDDVSISPQVFFGGELICYNESSGFLKVVLVNNGEVPIESVVHRQIGSDFNVVDTVLVRSGLGVGEVFSSELLLSPGRVQVELIPSIVVLNDRVLCTDKSVLRTNISVCT